MAVLSPVKEQHAKHHKENMLAVGAAGAPLGFVRCDDDMSTVKWHQDKSHHNSNMIESIILYTRGGRSVAPLAPLVGVQSGGGC
jgi:hypothetical protein